MTRTIALLLSTSALALAACADEAAETENAAENAANETGEAMNAAGEEAEQAWDDADGAMDGGVSEPGRGARDDGDTDEGMRFTEGDETPENDLGQNPAVNLAQDMAAGPAGLAAGVVAGLSGDVEAYVRNVTLGNMYEIQAGRIAMERGNSPDVQEIGRLIVQDHQELQEQLEAALAEAGLDLDLPTEFEGRRQGLIDNLNAASDVDFDAAFLHQQEAAHLEAVALHEGFEAAGEPEALTEYAGMAGNVVQGHLGEVTENLPAAVDGE
ncbi:MAG: DUF4142 domain-containing protein [Oceanicaulis sp.]